MKSHTSTAQIQTTLNARHDEIAQREPEIHKLANSVKDLSGTFVELHDLVIDQGSMFDNIEQNIEKAHNNMKAAKVEAQKAEETQEQSCRIL